MTNWNPDLEALEELKRYERPYPVRLMDAALFVVAPAAAIVGIWLFLVILGAFV